MGEAKRRKELGLMPVDITLPFSMQRGQEPQFEGQADDETLELMRRHISYRLGDTEGAWDREYRRAYLLDATQEVETREQLNKIATPTHARGHIALVTNKPEQPSEDALPIMGREGQWLRFKDVEVSFDGVRWQPRHTHVDALALLLTGHRALQHDDTVPQEVFFELGKDGQATFSSDELTLSDEAQNALQEELRDWYGPTPETWDKIYRENVAYFASQELSEDELAQLPTPQARRGAVFLYDDHLILPPFMMLAFTIPGFQVGINLEEEQVSLDGQTWQNAPGNEDDDEDDAE